MTLNKNKCIIAIFLAYMTTQMFGFSIVLFDDMVQDQTFLQTVLNLTYVVRDLGFAACIAILIFKGRIKPDVILRYAFFLRHIFACM